MIFACFPLALADLSSNWMRLITETCETLNAAVSVVKIRTVRIASAGLLPDERDRVEFSLMGREKSEAVAESLQAIGAGWVGAAVTLARETCRHLWVTSSAASDLAASQSPAQWLERQAALLQVAVASPATPFQWANLTTCVMQEGLAPIHCRATENARRLGALYESSYPVQ
jgi:hypothetical protein